MALLITINYETGDTICLKISIAIKKELYFWIVLKNIKYIWWKQT